METLAEKSRIEKVYRGRQEKEKEQYFVYESPAHICRIHERFYGTLRMLEKHHYHPLAGLKILDIGCGDGNMLRQFLQWGADPQNLAGIELRSEPVQKALNLNPNLDIRCGSAGQLPWPDASFDIVCQHTVFTSILDPTIKQQVAREMIRMRKPTGAIFWYDFFYNSPGNPDVRGIPGKEIKGLFPGFKIHLERITLAPPIARRIPERLLPAVYPFLTAFPILNTHYLGLFTC